MAFPSITTTFANPGNQGLQVGHSSGTIEAHYHAPEPPESPPQPSCFVPFRRDPDFVERTTLLDEIHEQCSAPASRVALVGVGGVGKSQLAIEHCYRTVDQSPQTWVFWVHASNTARLDQSFREIADQVKIRGRKDSQADIFKLVHDWLRREKNGPWLLVIDNADDAAVITPPPSDNQKSLAKDSTNGDNGGSTLRQHLSRYLPPSRHGSVLVTSRTKRVAMQIVEDSDVILIEPMHDAAAHALLYKKLGDQGSRNDGIAELATALDHMPLALVQAAAYIRERAPRCSVRRYLEKYYKSDREKTSLLKQQAGRLRRDVEASNSILITWQISFDYIQRKRKSAADLLSLMSFFDRQGIQDYLLYSYSGAAKDSEGERTDKVGEQVEGCSNNYANNNNDDDDNASDVSDNNEFEDDVLTLRDYSFITVTRDASTFEMHSLVQLATRTWLENQGKIDQWNEIFISNLCTELPPGEYESWVKCQALFPHARAALTQRPSDKETLKKWALLLYNGAWYAWQLGKAEEAEQMSTVSMDVRRELFGEDNTETLASMSMAGIAKRLRGKYEAAEAINKQVLAHAGITFGLEQHMQTLTALNNLAAGLRDQGKYEEAETIHRHTLARVRMLSEHDNLITLTIMGNLALVLERQCKYEEAEGMYKQILPQMDKVFGPSHPRTLEIMNNLAVLLAGQGKRKEAEAIHRQILAQREKVFGPNHPNTLRSMNNLASVLYEQCKYEESEAIHRRTLANLEKVLAPNHPDTLLSMSNLASVLYEQGKHEESEAINRQTLAYREKVLVLNHPDTLESMNNLATVLAAQGKYEESFVVFEKARAGCQDFFGKEHPRTHEVIQNHANALIMQISRKILTLI